MRIMNGLALRRSGRRSGRRALWPGLRSFFCSFGRSSKAFLESRRLGINRNMRTRDFLSTFMIIVEGFECGWNMETGFGFEDSLWVFGCMNGMVGRGWLGNRLRFL